MGPMVAKCSGNRQGGNCSQWDCLGDLRITVTYHREETIPIFRPRKRSQNVHCHRFQWPLRGKELKAIGVAPFRDPVACACIKLSHRFVDVLRHMGPIKGTSHSPEHPMCPEVICCRRIVFYVQYLGPKSQSDENLPGQVTGGYSD